MKKEDKITSYIIVSIYIVLIIFGLVSLSNPEWLQKISDPGKETEALTYIQDANQLLYTGQFNSAIPLYRKAIEIDSLNLDAWGNLGIAYQKTGKFQLSKNCYEKVRKISMKNDSISLFTYWFNLADLNKQIAKSKKDNNEALKYSKLALKQYKKAISIMPYDPLLAYKYAQLSMAMGDFETALEYFEYGINAQESFKSFYLFTLQKAYLNALNEDNEEVTNNIKSKLNEEEIDIEKYDIISFNKYRKNKPELALAYYYKGLILLDIYKQKDEAIKAFKQAVKINPPIREKINKLNVKI